MNNVNLSVNVITPPSTLSRGRRCDEIKQLEEYLEVEVKIPEDLSFIYVSQSVPPTNLTGVPWLKLDTQGSPIGLFFPFNGDYVNALPNVVVTDGTETTVEHGTFTLDINGASNAFHTRVDAIVFSNSYAVPPEVILTVVGGTLLDGNVDDNIFVYKMDVTETDVEVSVKTKLDTTSAAKTLIFNWMSIGKVAL